MVAVTGLARGASNVPRCRYQDQDSDMTLAEGLAEYYRANERIVMRPDSLSAESRELFRSHDICHVIFGLGTDLADETMADTRTLLSCNVGFWRYARYLRTNPEAKALFMSLGYGTVLLSTLRTTPRILRAVAERFKIRSKWPWSPPQRFFDMRLSDLRKQYGIKVI